MQVPQTMSLSLSLEGERKRWSFFLCPSSAEWDKVRSGSIRIECVSYSDPWMTYTPADWRQTNYIDTSPNSFHSSPLWKEKKNGRVKAKRKKNWNKREDKNILHLYTNCFLFFKRNKSAEKVWLSALQMKGSSLYSWKSYCFNTFFLVQLFNIVYSISIFFF